MESEPGGPVLLTYI